MLLYRYFSWNYCGCWDDLGRRDDRSQIIGRPKSDKKNGCSYVQVLLENKLHCANPKSFNDPFDSQIGYICDNNDNDSLFEIGKFIGLEHQDFNETDELGNTVVNEQFVKQIMDGVVEISDDYGMVCFSEKWNSILMWSHYANNHRGFVIGFDLDTCFSNGYKPGFELKKVKYKKRLPSQKMVASKIEQCEGTYKAKRELIVDLFWCRKAICWEREAEWRIIAPIYNRKANNYIQLPSEAIVEIVFGINMEDRYEDWMRNWIDEHGLKITKFKAIKYPDKYAIDRI